MAEVGGGGESGATRNEQPSWSAASTATECAHIDGRRGGESARNFGISVVCFFNCSQAEAV